MAWILKKLNINTESDTMTPKFGFLPFNGSNLNRLFTTFIKHPDMHVIQWKHCSHMNIQAKNKSDIRDISSLDHAK